MKFTSGGGQISEVFKVEVGGHKRLQMVGCGTKNNLL